LEDKERDFESIRQRIKQKYQIPQLRNLKSAPKKKLTFSQQEWNLLTPKNRIKESYRRMKSGRIRNLSANENRE